MDEMLLKKDLNRNAVNVTERISLPDRGNKQVDFVTLDGTSGVTSFCHEWRPARNGDLHNAV